MRRENRQKDKISSNKSVYITGGVLLLAIISFVISFVIYANKLDNDSYILDSEYLSKYEIDNNNVLQQNRNVTSASSSIGKTINEAQNNIELNNTINNIVEEKDNEEKILKEEKKTSSTIKKNNTEKEKKDPVFTTPIDGEILKEYAKDSLIYSETLKEWTTHLGIDVKAEKATIVKSSADGKVKDIKNDPRYGLTIIIEHSNGFETRYANLLTTEFVAEGEEVKAGQTIGTVGESSVYEIVDEPHLHFELLKNSESVNPMDYIKF